MSTVKCVSTHPEDLANGLILEPGEVAKGIDLNDPHNKRLVDEEKLLVIDQKRSRSTSKDGEE